MFIMTARLCACFKNYVCGAKEQAEFHISLHIVKQFTAIADWNPKPHNKLSNIFICKHLAQSKAGTKGL